MMTRSSFAMILLAAAMACLLGACVDGSATDSTVVVEAANPVAPLPEQEELLAGLLEEARVMLRRVDTCAREAQQLEDVLVDLAPAMREELGDDTPIVETARGLVNVIGDLHEIETRLYERMAHVKEIMTTDSFEDFNTP